VVGLLVQPLNKPRGSLIMAKQARLFDTRAPLARNQTPLPALQQALPTALLPLGHICRLCGTPVLVGERDDQGRWECRYCRHIQTEPLAVPVLSVT
jgi:hypothetical protein